MPPENRRQPVLPEDVPVLLLDWTNRSHWSEKARPCRYCGRPTHLRDDDGRPADKTCAEAEDAQQRAETARAYRVGRQMT